MNINSINCRPQQSAYSAPQKTKSLGFGNSLVDAGDTMEIHISKPTKNIEICGHTAAEFAPKSTQKSALSVYKEILCHWAGLTQKKAIADIKTMAEHGFRI